MATLTPVLGLSKPVVGADDDVWGNMWNGNADILDTLVKPIDLAPYLLKAGGTMTGDIVLKGNALAALNPVPLQQMNAAIAAIPAGVTQSYVDTADNLRVLRAGDTMTNQLQITAPANASSVGQNLLLNGSISPTIRFHDGTNPAFGFLYYSGSMWLCSFTTPAGTGENDICFFSTSLIEFRKNLSMANNRIRQVGAPLSGDEATNKTYVDGLASTSLPIVNGTAAIGNGTTWARADHIHGSDPTKLNDAPNDGAYYARRNLAWAVAPGAAITTDAPSDGTAYGRLNAAWQKTPWFTAKGNVMLGIPEPATIAGTFPSAGGGVIAGWYGMLNGIAGYTYYDGTTFRRWDAISPPTWFASSGGGFTFQGAAAGAKDSAVALTTLATIVPTASGLGSLGIGGYTPPADGLRMIIGGNVMIDNAVAWNMYSGSGQWKTRVAGTSAMWYADTSSENVTLYTAPSVAAGAVAAIVQRAQINPTGLNVTGTIVATGSIWAANLNGSFGLQDFGGGWWGLRLNSPGWRLQWNSANGDLQFVNDAGAYRFIAYSTGTFVTQGYISANGADGNGYGFTSGYGAWLGGSLYAASNVQAGGSVLGGYIRSYGDFAVDGNSYIQYARIGNGIQNYNGTMWCGDTTSCYLQRSNGDGFWRFVEWGTINFEVRPGGDIYVRAGVLVYGAPVTCRNGSVGIRFEAGNYSSSNTFLFGWSNYITNLVTVSVDNGGAVYPLANASDERVKLDIQPSTLDALATVNRIPLVEYDWLEMGNDPWSLKQARARGTKSRITARSRIGVIAQRVREVFPEGVVEGDDFEDHLGRVWGLDQNAMIALLVGATQQMAARLATLEGRHK